MGNRTIGILQPGYLPWLGFFEQIYKSDIFVIYDDVQYDKEGWRNRNRIKGPNGIQWLTVPVHFKLSDRPLVYEVRIDNKTNWRKKHLASISMNYGRAPFFKDYIDIFKEAYDLQWEYLVDIDLFFILKLTALLGMDEKKIVRSSTLDIEKTGTGKGIDKGEGNKVDRIINLCKFLDADTFYEGSAGKNYIDDALFEREGIKIEYQDYKHPVYRQMFGDFIPYLSIVDLLFNQGKDSLSMLTGKENSRQR